MKRIRLYTQNPGRHILIAAVLIILVIVVSAICAKNNSGLTGTKRKTAVIVTDSGTSSSASTSSDVGKNVHATHHVSKPGATNSTDDTVKAVAETSKTVDPETIEKAKKYRKEGDLEMAIRILEQGISSAPDDVEASELLSRYTEEYDDQICEQVVTSAKTYADAGDMQSALEEIVSGIDAVEKEDDELEALRDQYADLYKQQLIATAEELYNTEGYDSALVHLRNKSYALGEDSEISSLIHAYEELKPIPLSSLEPYMSDEYLTRWDDKTDIFGDEYNDIITCAYCGFSRSTSNATEYYRIDEYSRMTGTIILGHDGAKYETAGTIAFYDGDENHLIYKCDNIGGGFDPVTFDVDISEVKDLIVYISSPGWAGDGASGEVCLSNCVLYPKFAQK